MYNIYIYIYTGTTCYSRPEDLLIAVRPLVTKHFPPLPTTTAASVFSDPAPLPSSSSSSEEKAEVERKITFAIKIEKRAGNKNLSRQDIINTIGRMI